MKIAHLRTIVLPWFNPEKSVITAGLLVLLTLCSSWAAETTGPTPAASPRQRIQVTDPEVIRTLGTNAHARLLANYKSFELWDVPAETATAFAGRSGVTVRQGDTVIELHARKIDTSSGKERAARTVAPFEGKRLHLVQFVGPVKPEWHEQLRGLGLKPITYIPCNAYLVHGPAPALNKLRDLAQTASHIQWEGEYSPEHKIHPAAQKAAAKALRKEAADNLFALQLVLDADANPVTLQMLDKLKLELVKRSTFQEYVNLVLRLPPERLDEVAARPDVVSIQVYVRPQKRDERQGQILAGNLSSGSPSGPGYLAWLAGRGFTAAQFAASGFVVDVTDSGIDNGTTTPGHPGLYTLGNPAAGSRVVYNRLLGTPNSGSTIQACDGHGNINSHIIAGFNNMTGFPHTDAAGYHYGLGIAPFVRVGSSVIFDPDYYTDPDFAELQSRAYQDGARISCNSWGASVGGAYNSDCQAYDALVRDAQPSGSPFAAAGNQEMVIVFSAGNSGPSGNSIGSPGSAKNIISVGAAENVHPHSISNGGNDSSGNDGCSTDDMEANNADDIVSFSSRGPCDDGRIKPDLVGPGTHVTGGVGQQANPTTNGTALSCFRASGVCALPGGGSSGSANNFFPLGQQFYTTSSGTSHSCPAVGGGAALLRQHFINHNWATPSPAMTKAWLLNSSRYMTGVSANDTLPSSNQGMGSMNLGMAFDDVLRIRRDQLAADRFTASGQTRTFEGGIANTNYPLRVTLSWTDAPGSTTGNSYNNDLNLTVTVNGQTYLGNVFKGALSLPGGSADPRNNVESVFLPAGLSGRFTVTVTAANINSDGVPGNADLLDQDFALVIYNSSDKPVLLQPGGASLLAESCTSPNQSVDPGEWVTVSMAVRNVGPSNTTALVATLLPAGGVTAPTGPESFGVVPGNGGSVTQSFSFKASGLCGDILTATLQLQDGTNDYGQMSFAFPLGVLNTNFWSLTNATPIAIGALDGDVTPYPSDLSVSGLAGSISRVAVTLQGLHHTWPEDLDMALVSPSGKAVWLLSDVGGGFEVTNLTLTLADSGPEISENEPLASGIWRPSAREADAPLPSPAPAGPYPSALSAFAGEQPNGLWRLLVVDDYPSDDGGGVLGGWSLTITTTNRACCVDPATVDLAVSVQGLPDRTSISNVVLYTVTVTNRGPATASAVWLTNALSPFAAFLSASSSQGSLWHASNVVYYNLGTLAPGAVAVVQIEVMANAGPELSCAASVGSAQADNYAANNTALAVTPVSVPALAIQDATVMEGDSGTRLAVFVATLTQPSDQLVNVHYRTVSASALAGADFIAQTNLLEFAPGDVFHTIAIPVLGDTMDEDDEVFWVELFDPLNAALADAEATGTIVDDDPLPLVSISDTPVAEGQSGITQAVFSINLSAASGRTITLSAATTNGTAWAGEDYVAVASSPVIIPPGQTSTTFNVLVNGDRVIEPDETFFVQLFNPTNALLGDSLAQGTILSDDLGALVSIAGTRVTAESGTPPNGAVDAFETVTLSVALRNNGSLATTNLTATLLAEGGVVSPSGPQDYGALLPGGLSVSRPFTFTAGVSNCSQLTLRLAFRDGPASLGTQWVSMAIGGCLTDDFDPNIDLTLWSAFGGTLGSTVLATNYGGYISAPNSLWFGDNGSRFAATRPIDTADGGTVSFYLRLASGGSSPWEELDLPTEGIVLEYSTNGGAAWVEMRAFTNTLYYSWTPASAVLPAGAQGPAVQFRWRQMSHSGSCCDHWALDNVMINSGPTPPTIVTQPSSQLVGQGSAVTFNVEVTGSSPLRYQWQFNGAALSGQTAASLVLSGVTSNHAGAYSVVITNRYGAVTSAVAMLSVVDVGAGFFDDFDPGIDLAQWSAFGGAVGSTILATNYGGSVSGPNSLWFGYYNSRFITTRPINTTSGGTLAFQLRLGNSSSYTWEAVDLPSKGIVLECSTNNGLSWVELGRYDTTIYYAWTPVSMALPPAAQAPATLFRWRQLYNDGSSYDHWALDNVLIGTGPTPPMILSQPANTLAAVGGTATLSVTAAGSQPLSYQWQLNGATLSGQTAASLVLSGVTSNNAGAYSVVITNSYGAVTSALAMLSVVDVGAGFFDDFDPGIDLSQWSAFGGTVGSTILTTNYGGSVSGPNSLWFGYYGSRFITTRPVNTTSGGTLGFQLRLGSSTSYLWETVDLPGKGIILECSTNNGLNWVELGRYDTTLYYAWTPVSMALPAAAQSPATLFRWRQLSNSGSSYDHWALDNVLIGTGPTPAMILSQPANALAVVGGAAIFNVTAAGSQPLSYQWWFNDTNVLAGATNATLLLTDVATNQTGRYSVVVSNAYGRVVSPSATLTVLEITGDDFRIDALLTSNSRVVEHGTLSGDDRGGIAASSSQLFYSGDYATVRFDLADLSGAASLTRIYDTLISDLRTEQVYALGNGTNLLTYAGGTINTLIALDGITLLPTGIRVTLSQPINMTSGMLFSGFGRVVLWNGSRAYAILLPSGVVMDLGIVTLPRYTSTENWAAWGVAESWLGETFLVYVRDTQTIVRTRVPDGLTTVLASFSNLSDMACFTVSPLRNRWYFHHEYGSQFGGNSETVGYADATFSFNAGPTPPQIQSQPSSQVTALGSTASFAVVARGTSPLRYQWQFNGAALSGQTAASLVLSGVTSNNAGAYSVVITNSYGAVTSALAMLSVVDVGAGFFDDFDPGIDLAQWSAFGGAVGSTILTTNYGGSVSGPNSLWMGDYSSRYITTRPINTTSGGTLAFQLRFASGSSYTWEYLDLPSKGIVLECSTNNGLNWVELGRYDTNLYYSWTSVSMALPAAAQGPGTLFRWRQLYHNGSGYDHWALDNVLIGTGPTPPAILSQPVDTFAVAGGTAGFSVTVAGSQPLSYQWWFNGTNELAGATNATLFLTGLTTNHAGGYSVVVTNLYGSLTSSVATLTVLTGAVGRVGILGAPSTDSWNNDISNKISGTGLFAGVDATLVRSGYAVPTLAELLTYNAVLVYSDTSFNNGSALGDVLADYIDAGGGVVVATFAFNSSAFGTSGRIQSGGYLPFTQSSQSSGTSLSLVPDLATHPILAGVSSFRGGSASFHNYGITTTTGAVLVAHWNNGQPLVGTKQLSSGKVVGLNFFPPSSDSRSDFWDSSSDGARLMANALLWASQHQPMPPFLLAQPASQTAALGAAVSFNVIAGGTFPLAYQWRFNETNDLLNATNAMLVLSEVTSNNAGAYSVVITNSYGAVTSALAMLSVVDVGAGFFDDFDPGIDLAQWSAFGGTVGSTIIATNYGGNVSGPNSLWFGDYSSRYITTRPINTTSGGTLAFQLRFASGSSYPWEYLDLPSKGIVLECSTNNGMSWVELGRYDTTLYYSWTPVSMALPPAAQASATFFRWRQLSHSGSSYDHWALDNVLVSTGPTPPVIVTQPANALVVAGGTAIFSVTAAGSQPLSYQWQFNGAALSGQTAATLVLSGVTSNNAGAYSVVITNSYGAVTSALAMLSVVEVGAGFFDDFNPGIDLAQWSAFGGTVGSTIIATNYGGSVSWPNALWFGDSGSRFVTTRPLNTVGGGSIGFGLRFANSSSGTWETLDLPLEGVVLEYSVGGTNWNEIQRYTNSTYYSWTTVTLGIPPGAQGPSVLFRWRQLSHSGSGCDHWALDNVLIGTGPTPPMIIAQPANAVVAPGGTATFRVTVAGSQPLSYQWQFNGLSLSGQTAASLVLSGVTSNNAGAYSVVVANSYGAVTSVVAMLSVTEPGAGFFDDFDPGIDLAQWSAFGGTVGSTILATNYGGNMSSPNSLWFGDAGSRFATTRPLNTLGGGTISFGLRFANGSSSPWETLDDLLVEGVVLEYSANGGTTWNEIQRYTNSTYYSWTTVTVGIPAGAQGTSVLFRWRQLSHSGSDYDHWALDNVSMGLVAGTPPLVLSQPSNAVAVVGGMASFNVLAAGSQPLNYQWRFNTTNILAGATNSTLLLTSLTTNHVGGYSVVVNNGYGAVTSSIATLRVVEATGLRVLVIWDTNNAHLAALETSLQRAGLVVERSATDETRFDGTNPALDSFNAVIHLNGTTYTVDMPLAGQAALTNFVQRGGGYLHSEWNALECGAGRLAYLRELTLFDRTGGGQGMATLTVVPGHEGHPVLAGLPPTFSFPAGYSIGVAHSFATDPVTVLMRGTNGSDAVAVRQWGSGRIVGFHHAGNYWTNTTLSNPFVQQLYLNGVLWAASSNAPGAPVIVGQPANQTVSVGAPASFCVAAGGSQPLSYSWRRNGVPIPGATQSCYTVTNCQASDSGSQWSCLVSNAYGTVLSSNATITVLLSRSLVFASLAPHVIQSNTAQPYPSSILITNVSGWLSKVTVTLLNLTHPYPNELDILLVGPTGQKVMLMSDAVGGVSYRLNDVTLGFDDAASSALPQFGVVSTGVYRPTDFEPGDALPLPAPAGPYGTNLSIFTGSNPNGLWSLFIADDYAYVNDGLLGNGWSLRLEVLESWIATTLDGTNLVVSWPAAVSGHLESTTSLRAPITWAPLSPHPPIIPRGGQNTVTLPRTATKQFYRLRFD